MKIEVKVSVRICMDLNIVITNIYDQNLTLVVRNFEKDFSISCVSVFLGEKLNLLHISVTVWDIYSNAGTCTCIVVKFNVKTPSIIRFFLPSHNFKVVTLFSLCYSNWFARTKNKAAKTLTYEKTSCLKNFFSLEIFTAVNIITRNLPDIKDRTNLWMNYLRIFTNNAP